MIKAIKYIFILSIVMITLGVSSQNAEKNMNNDDKYLKITFGSGCFWCTEAIFERVNGVVDVTSGYSGGDEPNPTYELVCSGSTKYAEVTQITYDPSVISFQKLLEIFWQTHDPTTPNRQGADVGPQYRSVIFYHSNQQKEEAEFFKTELDKEKIWPKPIVTEISPFKSFYAAEEKHQDFYDRNPAYGYCNFVITPKIKKFEKVFADQLK